MPNRDRAAAAREYRARNRERVRAQSRASYAKHREKRQAERRAVYDERREAMLAARREAYALNVDEMRARNRANYAAHRQERVAYARERRREHNDVVRANEKARYWANRDAINERRKGYRKRDYDKIYSRIRKWLRQNPERAFLYHAKRLLNVATGIRIRDIPDDIAEAKAEQIKLHRLLRDSDGPRMAETNEDSARGEAGPARAEGIAQALDPQGQVP